MKTALQSTTTSNTSSKRIWGSSKGKSSDGPFSHFDEEADDMRPLGHGVSVYGGGGGLRGDRSEDENVELPRNGISIKTEIEVRTTDRLDYNDRLY